VGWGIGGGVGEELGVGVFEDPFGADLVDLPPEGGPILDEEGDEFVVFWVTQRRVEKKDIGDIHGVGWWKRRSTGVEKARSGVQW
jgi:hypothetical protein